jgi:hypothetical protein
MMALAFVYQASPTRVVFRQVVCRASGLKWDG